MTNIGEGNSFFNLAHIEEHTHIYGPGSRFTIWLQGCSLGCKDENSDLIISGRYQQSLRNTYLRLRGSTNQKLIYPHGSRLIEESDEGNEIEIVIDSLGSITTLGYPD